MANDPTPMLVSAVALIDAQGRILMQRRRFSGRHGGLWEFPGGKLEPGESPESALLREIEEELGIFLKEERLEEITFASGPASVKNDHSVLVIFLYACRSWQGTPECLDGEEIAWFAPSALPGLEMPPLDYPLAERLLAWLRMPSG